jgi:hypothetical protein
MSGLQNALTCELTLTDTDDLRSYCEVMTMFWLFDDYTDTCNTEDARRVCEATMDAIRHPDKPRPEGEPIFGEVSRQ